jgi:hypothetical protein
MPHPAHTVSDYLSRAASRADASAAPAVRPRLQSRYESAPSAAPAELEAKNSAAAFPRRELAPSGAGVTSVSTTGLHAPARNKAFPDLPLTAPFASDVPALPRSSRDSIIGGSTDDSPRASLESGASSTAEPAGLTAPQIASGGTARSSPAEVIVRVPAEDIHNVSGAMGDSPPPHAAPLLRDSAVPAARRQTQTHSATVHAPAAAPPSAARAPLLELPRTAAPPLSVSVTLPAPEQRTVNITIGRLEIRAATPASPPPRAARPQSRGPLGLDEFLRSKSPRRGTQI